MILPIWVMSLHVEAPFVKNFTFFIFGFFPEPSYDMRDAKNHIPGSPNSMVAITTRLKYKFDEIS